MSKTLEEFIKSVWFENILEEVPFALPVPLSSDFASECHRVTEIFNGSMKAVAAEILRVAEELSFPEYVDDLGYSKVVKLKELKQYIQGEK